MHYKIKDDVDLSLLEKEYEYIDKVNDLDVSNYIKEITIDGMKITICILFNREIAWSLFDPRMCFVDETNKHFIKDLIDAGLVEEVNND